MKPSQFALAGLVLAATVAPAEAQFIEEARIGVLAHNICVIDCKNANKEDGPTVEGELVLASPGVLQFLFAPRPYLLASVNVSGDTSYGGAGLLWNWDFAEGWSLEPGVGYVIHDGATESPFPQGSPESEAFARENVLLGSDDLFRTSLAINRDLGANWGLQVQYEHLSHGQILGDGRNQGMDSIGLRAYWRFGG